MVSALDGERQAHGSEKVSDLEYCELKQVLVKVGFYYQLPTRHSVLFQHPVQSIISTIFIHQMEPYCLQRYGGVPEIRCTN
jgi:uncharacterized protein YcgL (UPF0745 family)